LIPSSRALFSRREL